MGVEVLTAAMVASRIFKMEVGTVKVSEQRLLEELLPGDVPLQLLLCSNRNNSNNFSQTTINYQLKGPKQSSRNRGFGFAHF